MFKQQIQKTHVKRYHFCSNDAPQKYVQTRNPNKPCKTIPFSLQRCSERRWPLVKCQASPSKTAPVGSSTLALEESSVAHQKPSVKFHGEGAPRSRRNLVWVSERYPHDTKTIPWSIFLERSWPVGWNIWGTWVHMGHMGYIWGAYGVSSKVHVRDHSTN